jgi:hypothetical protein
MGGHCLIDQQKAHRNSEGQAYVQVDKTGSAFCAGISKRSQSQITRLYKILELQIYRQVCMRRVSDNESKLHNQNCNCLSCNSWDERRWMDRKIDKTFLLK